MRVFVSSVIGGMEPFREAAVRAARALGHEVKRSEDFPAMAESPQQACLAGVREADVVVLLLGPRYGHPQDSGLSATHEEYREARERRPVLTLVQQGVDKESSQEAFIKEVRTWQGGMATASFTTPEDLGEAVVRALHEFEMSRKAGEMDESEMLERAQALLPASRGIGSASLTLVVVGGPRQPVLRPTELEDPALERDLLRETLVGPSAVLSPAQGTNTRVAEHFLSFEQRDASVFIDDLGSVRIVQPARQEDRTATELPVLIEEDVGERLRRAIRISGMILDRIDPVHRLRGVLPVVSLEGAGYLGWRTRQEHARSPQSVQIPHVSDPQIVTLTPVTRPRAALLHSTDALGEDFLSVLRRGLRS
ncbi:MAG: DUF4062 domain-containing protein [Actinomycetota bacterium]